MSHKHVAAGTHPCTYWPAVWVYLSKALVPLTLVSGSFWMFLSHLGIFEYVCVLHVWHFCHLKGTTFNEISVQRFQLIQPIVWGFWEMTSPLKPRASMDRVSGRHKMTAVVGSFYSCFVDSSCWTTSIEKIENINVLVIWAHQDFKLHDFFANLTCHAAMDLLWPWHFRRRQDSRCLAGCTSTRRPWRCRERPRCMTGASWTSRRGSGEIWLETCWFPFWINC